MAGKVVVPKVCSKCRKELPLSSFYKIRHWRNGAQTYRKHCKSCEKERVAKWQKNNRDKCNKVQARWLSRNLEKHSAAQKERQTRKRRLLCNCCSALERREFYIGRPSGYEVDHIIPLALGGLHCVKNFQYLTPVENRKKGARL